MRVVVMVAAAVLFAVAGGAGGYYLGEYAPGGIAALAEPFSQMRDGQALHFGLLGGGFGALIGLVLGGFVQLGGAKHANVDAPNSMTLSTKKTGSNAGPRVRSELGLGLALVVLGLVMCVVGVRVDKVLCVIGGLMVWGGVITAHGNASIVRRAVTALPIAAVVTLVSVVVTGAATGTKPAATAVDGAPPNPSSSQPQNAALAISQLHIDEIGKLRSQLVRSKSEREREDIMTKIEAHAAEARLLAEDAELMAAIFHRAQPYAGRTVVMAGYFKETRLCDRPCDYAQAQVIALDDRERKHLPKQEGFLTVRVRVEADGTATVLAAASGSQLLAAPKSEPSATGKTDRHIAALANDAISYAGKTLTLRGYLRGKSLCDKRYDDEDSNSVELQDPDDTLPTRDGLVTVRVHVDDNGALRAVSR